MKERVTLNKKEQKRLLVINGVERGEVIGREAGEVLGLSLRHLRRLLAAYRKEGAAALAHGNRGRKPIHALAEGVRDRVLELAQSVYRGFNHQHFTELLAEREGIVLSRSTIRRVLLGAGIRSPRKRRPPKHRSRRERYPQEGMLLQMDGSPHDWLEGRGPWLSLISAIDDATGKVPHGLFRYQEDAQGYFLLLRQIVEKKGIPLAAYHDRHGIFQRSPKEAGSLEEQLEGQRELTQFGRLLKELGIESIPSRSPQAKGRIERLFGTLQDRLVSELRLAGARTLEEANKVLWGFLPRYNRRFAVSAAQPGTAYRPREKGSDLDEFFCFKYSRSVGADNVVPFGEDRLQIQPSNGRGNYYRARVEVQERMDGSLAVYYQGRCLATKPAPPEAPVLRVKSRGRKLSPPPLSGKTLEPIKRGKKDSSPDRVGTTSEKDPQLRPIQPHRPGPNHPWRKPWRTKLHKGDIFTEQLR